MTYRAERNRKKLSISPWRDNGSTGILVSIAEGGVSRSFLLTCANAEALVESLDEMLDELDEPCNV